MDMNSNSFVIVSWTESKKNEFSLIRIEDVFLNDQKKTLLLSKATNSR